jgi:ATP-dependent 26S proteasome regulatory subunit
MSGLEPSPLRIESGGNLPEVKLLPHFSEIEDLLSRTCEYFFKKGSAGSNSPFKGFLLEGPPGIGKTELVRQVARKLDRRLGNVFWLFVDGASVAAPRWGDAEKALRRVFEEATILRKDYNNPKILIHFDDIECLMLARGVELAKEWHYSINSILFHEIDQLDPSYEIVCATTNRPDLVDIALRDRLYVLSMPSIPLDQLKIAMTEILNSSGVRSQMREELEKTIVEKLERLKQPTLRDVRQITVIECITRRVWEI